MAFIVGGKVKVKEPCLDIQNGTYDDYDDKSCKYCECYIFRGKVGTIEEVESGYIWVSFEDAEDVLAFVHDEVEVL